MHGGMGYGRPDQMLRVMEPLSPSIQPASWEHLKHKKRDSLLITYKSGKVATQIDFILFHRTMCNLSQM